MPNINKIPQPKSHISLFFTQKPKNRSFFAWNKIKRTIKRNRIGLVLLVIILLAASLLIFKNNSPQDTNPEGSTQTQTTKPIPQVTPNPDIQNLLTKEIEMLPGLYAVYIKDLKTGQVYEFNSNQNIPGASLYKMTVMYKTYDSLEKGEFKKDQKITENLTVEEALKLMITVSDNESALALAEKLGWANINTFIKNQGIHGFNLLIKDYPETTAKATGDLLEKIYKKEAVSKNASEEMLNLLLDQQINDRIPDHLPLNVEVAHKTGELDNFRHDAGIVFGKKSDYVFVFLTENPKPQDAYGNIANLSKTLYEALEN